MRRISGLSVFIKVFIVLTWVVLTGLLVERHYLAGDSSLTAIPRDSGFFKDQWMGIYFHGEKAGYSHRNIVPVDHGYEIKEIMNLNMSVLGEHKNVETSIKGILDNELRLISFDLSIKSDVDINIKGKVADMTLFIDINTLGNKSSRSIELTQIPSLNTSILPSVFTDEFSQGKRLSLPVFDPSIMSVGELKMEVLGSENIMIAGIEESAYKVGGDFRGMEFYIWYSEDGEILKEESAIGYTLVKEDPDDAVQPGRPSLDLLAGSSIPFNLTLPENTEYLKVRISGVDIKGLDLNGDRQILKGDMLEVRKSGIRSVSKGDVQAGSGNMNEYLSPTIFVNSADNNIMNLSREIVRGESDKNKAVKLIYEWVYKNIKKSPAITIPMATDVLKTLKGDCNEHTVLFTALSRAAGIPTRMSAGLLYSDGSFYYHTWPEVYTGQWMAIDPTAGRFPADASYIRLITGDLERQADILRVMGRIKLEGISFR